MKLWGFIVFVAIAWPASLTYLTYDAFDKGYIQGSEDGCVMSEPEIFTQCTAWWFDGNEPRAIKEINKYCERRKK